MTMFSLPMHTVGHLLLAPSTSSCSSETGQQGSTYAPTKGNSSLLLVGPIYYLPDATMSDARGGQSNESFKKTYLSPQFSRKWRSSLFLKILSIVSYCTIKTATQPRMLSLTPKILNLTLTLTVSLTG